MKLLLDEQRQRLRANGQFNATRREQGLAEIDFMPVVKLFTPRWGCTWLLTELDPGYPDIAFGLCDLGSGCPELGTVHLSDLEELKTPLGSRVECDGHFKADKTLTQYAEEAVQLGYIPA
jgi:hypothetical protein